MAVRSNHAARPVRKRKASLPLGVKLAYGGAAGGAILAAGLIGVHVLSGGKPEAPAGAAASYAGSLELDASGAELASWNQTSSFCPQSSWTVPDGTVSTDPVGNAMLTTTGKPGSCVAIISPGTYASGVIEADIDFPALPGKSGTVADWTAFWLTDQAHWPVNGEIDAVETEPLTGVNAVSYHWGTTKKPLDMSTDGLAPNGKIPFTGPNLTPGWHVVDIAFTKGFFAVYYDGKEFAGVHSSAITGAPLNVLLNSAVTPSTKAAEKTIGGKPKNSDSSPATVEIKYLRVWSYNGS
jgi:hypothetical protein